MVEANSDPEVVTALIRRESREAAAAHAAQAPAPQTAAVPYTHLPVRSQAASETTMAAVDRPRPDTPAPTAGFWNSQLVFALALVLVLLAVWVAERRSVRRKKEEKNGR